MFDRHSVFHNQENVVNAQPTKFVVNQPLPHMGIRFMNGTHTEALKESFYRILGQECQPKQEKTGELCYLAKTTFSTIIELLICW